MAKLAVFFPGIGYHCDKPLLYYGRDIAYEAGYEKNINISYEYPGFDIKNPDSMSFGLIRKKNIKGKIRRYEKYK